MRHLFIFLIAICFIKTHEEKYLKVTKFSLLVSIPPLETMMTRDFPD